MNTSNKNQLNRNQNPPQANAEVARPKAKTIKLGIDVHLDRYGKGKGSVLNGA